MQITVLMENSTQNPTLAAEHGLSLFIRHGGRSWLLDAGASGDFVKNADALGLPPEQVEAAILSHGHYDHGGGLAAFFARNHAAPVYAMRAAGECYLSGDGPTGTPSDCRTRCCPGTPAGLSGWTARCSRRPG